MNKKIILSAHQPLFMPYPGFWYRVINSDIFDLGIYDPWMSGRYIHRVPIGGDSNWRWLTLPVEAHLGNLIKDVKIKNNLMSRIFPQIEAEYHNTPNWDKYKDDLKYIFTPGRFQYLWELNHVLILWMRDCLNVKTPICISHEGIGNDTTERIASQMKHYKHDIYLSGINGKNYMNEERYKEITGAEVMYIDYAARYPYEKVSLIEAMMHFDDPISELSLYDPKIREV